MAKIRIRALQRAFDGTVRREPGDEFDYDEEVQGKGKWYEVLDAPERKPQIETKAKAESNRFSKKRRKKKDDDDLV